MSKELNTILQDLTPLEQHAVLTLILVAHGVQPAAFIPKGHQRPIQRILELAKRGRIPVFKQDILDKLTLLEASQHYLVFPKRNKRQEARAKDLVKYDYLVSRDPNAEPEIWSDYKNLVKRFLLESKSCSGEDQKRFRFEWLLPNEPVEGKHIPFYQYNCRGDEEAEVVYKQKCQTIRDLLRQYHFKGQVQCPSRSRPRSDMTRKRLEKLTEDLGF